MSSASEQVQHGPPYVPDSALPGGSPTIDVDVPILAILMVLYLGGAIMHMTVFQLNRRHGIKFIMSAAMFGFCMARIATCSLRIAWAVHPTNVSLAIAAQIFTNVGVIVAYVVLLLLSSRLLRATHPHLGWARALGYTYKLMYFLLLVAVALLVSFLVASLYTLDTHIRTDALWIERAGILYTVIFTLVSLVNLTLSVMLPKSAQRENFGAGSIRSKMVVLAVALFFTLFIVGFRAATLWAPKRPRTDPAWYDEKPAFYVIEFGFEVIIIYWLAITRFDRRFWVPNGSNKPGDYSQFDDMDEEEKTDRKPERLYLWFGNGSV